MSKDPAFLFYPADASEDTQFMNRLERGAYFDLVKSQRLFHGFTTEQLRKVLGKDFDIVFPALDLILKKDDSGFYIRWVRESLDNRKEFQRKQKEKIDNYWNNRGNTVVKPLESGNGIENVNEIKTVIEYLNSKAGKNFKITAGHSKHINARLREGFTVEELKLVVDTQVNKWVNDIKMVQYLRPETLFNSEKCDGYLQNAKTIIQPKPNPTCR